MMNAIQTPTYKTGMQTPAFHTFSSYDITIFLLERTRIYNVLRE